MVTILLEKKEFLHCYLHEPLNTNTLTALIYGEAQRELTAVASIIGCQKLVLTKEVLDEISQYH
ncbi:hypothetical protein BpHYR1_016016 [Brachionus plicatilis]|uniref:Uncharacterized protein n=1 Tax=Brachionus plicatilis TaxID=10195 RepID=A0A3M7QDX3_BRAPC|nr:hypothetical protein BpHYR1_016016 [Brachionus plicatilis]